MSATSSPVARIAAGSEKRGRSRLGRQRRDLRQQIQRTGRRAHRAGGDLQVARGGGKTAVTEQQLNAAHVGAGFEQVGGKRVAQGVRSDWLGDASRAVCLAA